MSLPELSRRLGRLGPDKLISEMRELRAWLDHLRERALRELPPAAGVGLALDRMDEAMGKVEGLLVNMQSSCVRLPKADAVLYPRWEVPVITAAEPALDDRHEPWSARDRFFRIGFELECRGRTYHWKLREHDFDTGIPVV